MEREVFRALLAVTTSSFVLLSQTAQAQVVEQKATHSTQAKPAKVQSHSKSQTAARSTLKPPEPVNEQLRVVGHGSTRQIQTMTGNQILSTVVPGTTPLKALGTLPGVAFNSADPLGIDLWAQSFYVRGFTSLGFTLDGIPLDGQGYNSSGANINTAISSQNIASASVSQGAGGVEVPSTNNLGGVMQFKSMDPSDKMGGKISQTFGSYSSFQTFARFDSGILNKSGTKFFASYSRTAEDKWKGEGSQFLQQVNFKLVQPLGENTKMSAFFDWDQSGADTYADMSKEEFNKLGDRVDYYKPNYAAAYHAAEGIYPAGYNKLSDPEDASYYDGPATGHDYLGGLNFDTHLTPHLRWNTTLYAHGKSFNAYWTNPYQPSPNGAPLSEQNEGLRSVRTGINTSWIYHIAHHTIDVGVWYQNTEAQNFYKYYEEPILGEGNPINPLNSVPDAYAEKWRYGFRYDTVQTHIQDTYHVTKNFTINAGFRSIIFSGTNRILANDSALTGATSLPHGTIHNTGAFLPAVSMNYRFLKHHEVFFDFAENMETMTGGGYQEGTPWSGPTQTDFNYAQNILKPEKVYVYELGYRYTSPWVVGLLALYHNDYRNRQVDVVVPGTGIVSSDSRLMNVGGVDMNGVDASVTVFPIHGLSVYNSISYNSSKYANNYTSDGTVYNIKGKQEVNYPELMYKGRLSYEYKHAFAHIDTMYMGKRYMSFNNDTSVKGYWLTNLGAGYHFGDHSVLKNLTINFNVYNLTNIKYISDMGEEGNQLSGDMQTLQAGAPREYFGSISANF